MLGNTSNVLTLNFITIWMYQPYLNFIISSACSSTCFCNGFSSGFYHTHYMACNTCSMQRHTLLFVFNVFCECACMVEVLYNQTSLWNWKKL